MDFSKILPAVATIAPTIAGLLGGPLASMGVQALESVFGLAPGSGGDPAVLQRAVAGMTPETAIALAKIDAELKTKLVDAGIDLERISAGDRDSARKMQIETKDWTPRLLAMLLVVGYFAVLGFMLKFGIPKDIGGSEALLLMIGALGTSVTTIIAFYYGSSAGSASKDATIKAAVVK